MDFVCKALIVICLIALIVCAALLVSESAQERIRRKKHPKWYELYNRAEHNAIHLGSTVHEQTETLNKRMKLLNKTYLEDKCTEDEYIDAMNILTKEYSEIVKQFKQAKADLHIEADMQEADAYAKEHNLKWGIIYE